MQPDRLVDQAVLLPLFSSQRTTVGSTNLFGVFFSRRFPWRRAQLLSIFEHGCAPRHSLERSSPAQCTKEGRSVNRPNLEFLLPETNPCLGILS